MRVNFLFVAVILGLIYMTAVTSVSGQPVPIDACKAITEPGSYVLTANLSSMTDCLIIESDFVTIDLDGFLIAGIGGRGGPATGTGIGTGSKGVMRSGIAIHDGTVTNFEHGINIEGAAIIERIRALNNKSRGIQVYNPQLEGSIIKDCIVTRNTIGILATNAVITGNSAMQNVETGIEGYRGTLIGNTASNNSGVGIVGGFGSTLVNNSATFNAGTGLLVQCPGAVIANTAAANGTNIFLMGNNCANAHNAP